MASSASSRQSRSLPSKRYGSEVPRIWTKPLRKLTPKTSLGFSVIEFAEVVLEIELLPWQKWLLVHMLELLPDNTLRFRTVIVLVARQNGKSTLSQVIALWFMYVYRVALVIGTAQDLDVAEEIWQGAVELAEESEDLAPLIERVVKVNGKKALEVDADDDGRVDTRYKVKAANRRAGRGLSGDLILLDELREHQSWDAWGAITKTTIARAQALILALSNAGDATSVVLRHLRQMCIQALVDSGEIDLRGELDDDIEKVVSEYIEDGLDEAEAFANDDDSVAIFEWSALPGCNVLDRDGWAMANPSLGYTITERTLASAARTDPEWVFRTECLCQWSDGTLEGPFPPGSWEAGRWVDPGNGSKPGAEWQIVGKVKACVDVSHDRTMTYISFAGRRADGLPQAEIVAQRAGQSWVQDWLTDAKRKDRIEEITGQTKGAPVSQLMKELKLAGLPVVDWTGDELAGWTGAVYDMVRAGAITDTGEQVGVRHLPQPSLDLAAATAVTKPLGDRFVWDRKNSPADCAPLVAFTGALALLTRKTEAPLVSVYESRRLEVL